MSTRSLSGLLLVFRRNLKRKYSVIVIVSSILSDTITVFVCNVKIANMSKEHQMTKKKNVSNLGKVKFSGIENRVIRKLKKPKQKKQSNPPKTSGCTW